MGPLSQAFYQHSRTLQEAVFEANKAVLPQIGAAVGQSLAEGGVLHTFGSGHSSILAREIVHRAGGLVPVSAITDPSGGWPETLAGYGTKLFQRYQEQYGCRPGEIVIVISNSGKNPSPIDVSLSAKASGAKVIALTAMPMSRTTTSNHSSGQRLFETADWVLDTLGETGDAVLPIPGESLKTGPMSSVSGVLLMNLLVLEAIDWMVANGHTPPILQSANTPGGRERNSQLSIQYRGRLCRPL